MLIEKNIDDRLTHALLLVLDGKLPRDALFALTEAMACTVAQHVDPDSLDDLLDGAKVYIKERVEIAALARKLNGN